MRMAPAWTTALRIAIIFLAFVTATPAQAASLTEKIGKRLDAWFAPDKPGAAVLVLRRGETLFVGVRGLADLERKIPLTPESVFDLASVSKNFTAAAILLLIEQGKLDPAAPLAAYVPEFKLRTKGRPITINDALHHLSGLPDYTNENHWKGGEDEYVQLDTSKHVLWLNQNAPGRRPGVIYEYNNSGYMLLARVIEKVTGASYADYIEQTFFKPLGMGAALVYRKLGQIVPNLALGYKKDKKGRLARVVYPMLAVGDGNIFASVLDLGIWDNALRQGKILKEQSLRTAWTKGKLDNGRPIVDEDGWSYGAGWYIDKRRKIVAHSGGWAGFSSYYHKDLGHDITVVALCNQENIDLDELAEELGALAAAP